ncbi:MAG TPA: hypothetical protein VJB09_01240 [Candidatus Paceibacterota bacterium]
MKKLLNVSSVLAILAGLVLIAGGVWGMCFTYKNIKAENIVTPADASIPGKQVLGPLTLKSQADVIRMHTLKMTGGKTYAEMPRQIEKLDEAGQPVLGPDGKAVMVPNDARNTWITATTLTTALHLGILTYVFSALVMLFGLISVWTGFIFCKLAKKQV